jgi:hypothetical protein
MQRGLLFFEYGMRAIFIMNPEQGDDTNRYPYDSREEWEKAGDYDEALDELNASRKDGDPHIPTFVQRMLERLKEVGLLHRTDTEPPSNVRRVPLDEKQDLWIRFDTRRDYDEEIRPWRWWTRHDLTQQYLPPWLPG